jgi:hypothetical protein
MRQVLHRHLNTTYWTRAAIDSCLEYGDLPDWRELFGEVRNDRRLAQEVLAVCRGHYIPGSSVAAEHLVLKLWPDLATEAPAAPSPRPPR